MKSKPALPILNAAIAIFLISFMGLAATSRADGQEANVHSPVFMAPGFQFEQVDTLCILPIAGSANDEQQRLALMWKLQDNGYRIADPNCYRESSTSNGMPGKKPHWMLKISTDELEAKPVGQPPKGTEFIAYQMIAVLLDNNSGKEVWRDTEVTKYLPTKTDRVGEINVARALKGFEKKKTKSQPSEESRWAPMSVSVIVGRPWYADFCQGLLRLDSGILSFDPSSNGSHDGKCASFQFSVPGAQVKPGSRMEIPGKGKYEIEKGAPVEILTLNVALRNLR